MRGKQRPGKSRAASAGTSGVPGGASGSADLALLAMGTRALDDEGGSGR